MRWSIIRLIWLRELRDQLRDRRTVFMIVVLPVLVYPVAGFGLLQLWGALSGRTHLVGVAGHEHLLPWSAGDFPPLLQRQDDRLQFAQRYRSGGADDEKVELRPLDLVGRPADAAEVLQGPAGQLLRERRVDLLLVVPDDFQQALAAGRRPPLYVLGRDNDDTSRQVNERVTAVLRRWQRDLREVRLRQLKLPPDVDEPVRFVDPERAKPVERQQQEGLIQLLGRVFPFILVLWSLAGALYPAVDLCAGEKERGTMETLLISPASREEIVYGKFLTIWVFSAVTALLNLASMALTTLPLGRLLPGGAFSPLALFWGVALLLPLSAFFSALCLAVGAYARSSKEGQYYLMPLFLVTMPLIFLTLAPGVELNPFYSMVPVTGVALLLQRLMVARATEAGPWLYFVPVLLPMVVYSWLALRWAIAQFQREEVLFREAERLDVGLWLRRLLREKETLPSAGEAVFCFGLILALRWLSFGVGDRLLLRTAIAQIAFVAAPPLFMALLLTTRPAQGLGLRRPAWWAWLAALLLPVALVVPLAELTLVILRQFHGLLELMELNHPLTRELRALAAGDAPAAVWQYFLVLAVLPAVCEELAFRGFLLAGLLRSFRPATAAVLSAFLFALYQMNVFQFLPHFVLGLVLAVLAVRSGSVLPAMAFHLVYNSLLLAPVLPGVRDWLGGVVPDPSGPTALRVLAALGGAALTAGGLAAVWRGGRLPAGRGGGESGKV